jgi:hypothetical protein
MSMLFPEEIFLSQCLYSLISCNCVLVCVCLCVCVCVCVCVCRVVASQSFPYLLWYVYC